MSFSSPHTVETSRGPIEVVRGGMGSPILALHGGMGGYDQGVILGRALFRFIETHHLVAVSRPGYLGSPLRDRLSAEEQADLYAALLDELDIEKVVVVAVSAGGPSAIAFAARHPARCRGLILISAATGALEVPDGVQARMRAFKRAARLPGFLPFMRWMTTRKPERAAERSIRDPSLRTRMLRDPLARSLWCELQRSIFRRLDARIPGTLNDMAEGKASLDSLICKISCPVLAVHGTADSVVPFSHAEKMAWHGADLMEIADGEHVVLFTHIEDVRRRVRQFLDSNP